MVARPRGELLPPLNLMSRRKQANPKPLKRNAENDLEELSDLVQLPRDALVLQGCSDDEGDEENEGEVRLLAKVALRPGRLFGPYAGYVTREDLRKALLETNDARLETFDEGGQKLLVVLKDETGSWMKLLKSSPSPDHANFSIYSDGITIWCSVTSQVDPETELLAVYRGERPKGALNGHVDIHVKPEPLAEAEPHSAKEDDDCRPRDRPSSVTSGIGVPVFPYAPQPAGNAPGNNVIYIPLIGQSQMPSPRSPSVCSASSDQERTTRGFACTPCGISFSSQRTLQAHQARYCSFREVTENLSTSACQAPDQNSDQERASERTTPKSGAGSPSRISLAPGKRPADEERPEDGTTSDGDTASQTGDTKSIRSSRPYQCPYCSYVTERKGGLTRHMRIHASPPTTEVTVDLSSPRSWSRYCTNCDIQFSSFKTYQVHKAYYCSTRRAHKSTNPSATPNYPANVEDAKKVISDVTLPSGVDAKTNSGAPYGHPFYAAISTSPLILVPFSCLPGGTIIPTGNIVVPNGTSEVSPISPVPAFTILPSPVSKPEAAAVKVSSQISRSDSTTELKTVSSNKEDSLDKPLDLSTKRRASVEECSPSTEVPGTSVTTPKTVGFPPMASPGLCGGSASSLVTNDTMSSHVLVKQGTSKCKECNIVFFKYENYLAHKQNYCASRPQKTSSRSGSSPETPRQEQKERSVSSPENSVSPGYHPTASQSPKSVHCQSPSGVQQLCQYYCMACGITFTSLDNLHAHQMYYCSKRETLAENVKGLGFRCAKCKSPFTSEEALKLHSCGLQRKCPYCDVFCPTLSAAQRHLVTHTGVKAFRCTICGYKGHTLRGMRTHIRIHLDANNGGPEENFIVCVGEDGGTVGSRKNSTSESSSGSPVNTTTSKDNSETPMEVEATNNSSDSSHCCQFCGYTSSYKGNVVRHIKLVHRDFISSATKSSSSAGAANRDKTVEATWTVVKKEPSVTNNSDLSNDSRSTVKAESIGNDHDSSSPVPITPTETPECILPDTKEEKEVEDLTCKRKASKYCKSCDITFNHLSNFIAHKMYYCTTQPAHGSAAEPTAV